MLTNDKEAVAKFWSRVEVRSADECWGWITTSKNKKAYGSFGVHGISVRAHRFSYELAAGRAIGAGMFILHSCDNPPCVNPAHLREGTARDNSDDRTLRNRVPRGEASGASRLTERSVLDIRRRFHLGEKMSDIARMYHVSVAAITNAAKGSTWSHVEQTYGARRKREVRAFSQVELLEIMELHLAKQSTYDISRKLGCTIAQVRKLTELRTAKARSAFKKAKSIQQKILDRESR